MKNSSFKFKKTAQALLLALLVIPFFSHCKKEKEPEPPKSSDKEMTNVSVSAGGESFPVEVLNAGSTFEFLLPIGFDENKLKTATVSFTLSKAATSNPAAGTVDLSPENGVTFTVTAEDESTKDYTIRKVTQVSHEAAFVTFSIIVGDKTFDGIINDAASKVTIAVPYSFGDDLEDATPTFTISPWATVTPALGVPQNFGEPVEYVITALDRTTIRTWTVEVNVLPPSEEANIEVFYLDFWMGTQGAPGTPTGHSGDFRIIANIDSENGIISYDMPVLPNWFTPAKMTVFPAVLQLSECWSKCEPNWDEPQDFTHDVQYAITAEDGVTTKVWTVKAPKFYMKEKWGVDYKTYEDAGNQNPNSIAIIGDYVALSRTQYLINKSDGTKAAATLNVDGIAGSNASTTQTVPFFITNDDAGHMIGGGLNPQWSGTHFALWKWTSATTAPDVLMEIPVDVAVATFGRKIQALGDVDGKALIVSPNNWDQNEGIPGVDGTPAFNQAKADARKVGEHYIWTVNSGVVNTGNPTVLQTHIPRSGWAYQMVTPLGLDPVAPYYVGSHCAQTKDSEEAATVTHAPNLQFGELGSTNVIQGPYDGSDGWGPEDTGSGGWFYQKLFELGDVKGLATFSGGVGEYRFTLLERQTEGVTLVPFYKVIIPWNKTDEPNGNLTGSFTMEKDGDDVLFYVFPTNKGVYCYQLSEF